MKLQVPEMLAHVPYLQTWQRPDGLHLGGAGACQAAVQGAEGPQVGVLAAPVHAWHGMAGQQSSGIRMVSTFVACRMLSAAGMGML